MKVWKSIVCGVAGVAAGALAEYGAKKAFNRFWPDNEFDEDHDLRIGDGVDEEDSREDPSED